MNKTQLVMKVASACGLAKAEAERAVEATFNSISSTLKGGEEVRLVGFGTFEVVNRAASIGRNPRTGEPLKIAASRLPKFRAGKQLKDAVSL